MCIRDSILAFYFRMFHVQNAPEIVVLTFIYKPKKSFVGKVYDKFMRYIAVSYTHLDVYKRQHDNALPQYLI